ncbi:MAG: hypothetical protein NZ739_01605 [Verrucomicrobiae bacterium]|nr:hypothetical protein [Verrucomicrobiae bacterium]
MKRIIASAGVVALGATGVHALDYAPGFGSTDMAKPWSVSLTLRGFYDDNYLTRAGDELDSWGFTLRPAGSVAYSTGLTDVGARYAFTAYYFADRPGTDWDFAHQFDGYLSHAFSHRYNLFITDSFVFAREPELFEYDLPYRSDMDHLRNVGTITLNAQMTQLLTLVLGYSNSYYDYEQEGLGSLSARLDRVEHLISANLQWQLLPTTVGVVGYQFGLIDFISDDELVPGYSSDIRNSYNHYIYVGADHAFNPDLTASARVGTQYADFYNHPGGFDQWEPYANVSLRYRYGQGSFAEAGFIQQYTRTDVRALTASSSIGYASIRHAFTPTREGSILGRIQYSVFDGQIPGVRDYSDWSQLHYAVGLNLTYAFNRHVSAEIGYNFDQLDSDEKFERYQIWERWDFTRNRVYFGVTAKY